MGGGSDVPHDLLDEFLSGHLGVPARKPHLLPPRHGLPYVQHVPARVPCHMVQWDSGHQGPVGDAQPEGDPGHGGGRIHYRLLVLLCSLARVGAPHVSNPACVLPRLHECSALPARRQPWLGADVRDLLRRLLHLGAHTSRGPGALHSQSAESRQTLSSKAALAGPQLHHPLPSCLPPSLCLSLSSSLPLSLSFHRFLFQPLRNSMCFKEASPSRLRW